MSDFGLAAGSSYLDRLVDVNGGIVRFLVAQCAVGVVGDLRVNGDADVGKVGHQALSFALCDFESGLLDHGLFISLLRKCFYQFLEDFEVPGGVGAGLPKKVGIIGKQAQDFFGEVRFKDILELELNGLHVFFIMQVDQQFLPGVQLNFTGFAGERVCAVHHDDTAEAVQDLAVDLLTDLRGHFGEYVGQVAPAGHTVFIAWRAGNQCVAVDQRCAVVGLMVAGGPDGQRRGVDDQLAGHLLDVGEEFGDIFIFAVINRIGPHRVQAGTGISLAAVSEHADGVFRWQAIYQHVCGAAQRFTVEHLARALRDQCHRFIPGDCQNAVFERQSPEALCHVQTVIVINRVPGDYVLAAARVDLVARGNSREGIVLGQPLCGGRQIVIAEVSAVKGFLRGSRGDHDLAVIDGIALGQCIGSVFQTGFQRGITFHLLPDEGFKIFAVEFFRCGGFIRVAVAQPVGKDSLFAGLDLNRLQNAVRIAVGDGGDAFQHAEDAYAAVNRADDVGVQDLFQPVSRYRLFFLNGGFVVGFLVSRIHSSGLHCRRSGRDAGCLIGYTTALVQNVDGGYMDRLGLLIYGKI